VLAQYLWYDNGCRPAADAEVIRGRHGFHSLWVIMGVVLQIRAVTLSTLISHIARCCRSWRRPGSAGPG
jgi:hypothetical protein